MTLVNTWHRALTRPKRAIFVSSSIGLGHIQRDLAVARELRTLVPDLEIHWWAQHPVTTVLEAAGERIHPKSRLQALESAHWEEESSQHELHAFHAFRRMDEILVANFMLFHEAVQETPYDLWIGDESWEVDTRAGRRWSERRSSPDGGPDHPSPPAWPVTLSVNATVSK